MTPSYLTRLLLLSSASFFLVQILVGGLVAFIAPAAIHRARTARPQRAGRWLLALRLLPSVLSVFVVLALCVPSYLRFEPRVAEEEVGFACLAAAILGALTCVVAMYRALGALIRSSLYVRRCGGLKSRIDGETVWIVEQNAGFALAGIMRPRLLISERAMRELSGDQLAVALRHECAHRVSRDNFKRLLILLAPAMYPKLRALEQAWIKCAEWAADDRASAGDAEQSATLASALVRVARLQCGTGMPALITSLVEADEDFSVRVDRLLHAAPVSEPNFRGEGIALAGAMLFIASIAMDPGVLRIVHRMLEYLLD